MEIFEFYELGQQAEATRDDAGGYGTNINEQIAEDHGCKPDLVAKARAVFKCFSMAEIKQLNGLSDTGLRSSHAAALTGISKRQLRLKIAKKSIRESWSVRRLRSYIKSLPPEERTGPLRTKNTQGRKINRERPLEETIEETRGLATKLEKYLSLLMEYDQNFSKDEQSTFKRLRNSLCKLSSLLE